MPVIKPPMDDFAAPALPSSSCLVQARKYSPTRYKGFALNQCSQELRCRRRRPKPTHSFAFRRRRGYGSGSPGRRQTPVADDQGQRGGQTGCPPSARLLPKREPHPIGCRMPCAPRPLTASTRCYRAQGMSPSAPAYQAPQPSHTGCGCEQRS